MKRSNKTMENEKKEPVRVTEEDVEKVKEGIKEAVIKEHGISEEQAKLYEQMVKEAQMPVTMKDEDFELGIQELDIRGLSKKNKEQMFFRSLVLFNVYSKQILTSLIDTTRLLMIIADKLGIEDIIEATDDILEKIAKQRQDINDFMKNKDKQSA